MELGYVPMFIDNITWTNDSFRQQAESVCGNNTNCLFDVAVTVDTSFGESTKRLEENNNQLNSKLGKIFQLLIRIRSNEQAVRLAHNKKEPRRTT